MLVNEQPPATDNFPFPVEPTAGLVPSGDRRPNGLSRPRRKSRQHQATLRALENLTSLFEQMLVEQSSVKSQVVELNESLIARNFEGSDANADKSREKELLAEISRLQFEMQTMMLSSAEGLNYGLEPDEANQRVEELAKALAASEKSVEDLAEENRQLRSQLASQSNEPKTTPSVPKIPAGNLSWDEMKKLMMEELDGEDASAAKAAESESMSALIESSQNEIDRRDQEIAELRRLLEEKGCTAVEHVIEEERNKVLDADEIIRQERERLRETQAMLDEKLRQAEIDLSLERARLARERQLLDERQQSLGNVPANAEPGQPGVKKRNWLASLGLDRSGE